MNHEQTPEKSQRPDPTKKTPQHSTPIKNKWLGIHNNVHHSPASSISPVKQDMSCDPAVSHLWDSPSILRAGEHSAQTSISQDITRQQSHANINQKQPAEMQNTITIDGYTLKNKGNVQLGNSSTSFGRGDEIIGKQSESRTELTPLETSTIQKQRVELELLIAELRDRDRELNEMVASHQKQLLSWEMDRQIILNLSQKCSRLQGDLDRKSEQLRNVSAKIRVLKAQLKQKDLVVQNTQNQLSAVSAQHSKTVLKAQDLEDVNTNLNESMKDLSTTLGELEAKEEKLKAQIQHKDRELINASHQISDMIMKLKKLDEQYKELRRKELEEKKDVLEWKEKYAESRKEVEHLKGDLNRSSQEEDENRNELLKCKQQIEVLKQQLMLAGERERRKDDLIVLQKSKQERADAELSHIRLLYERQQRDLSILHLNLESTKQLLARQRHLASPSSSCDDMYVVDSVEVDITDNAVTTETSDRDTSNSSKQQEKVPQVLRKYSSEIFEPLKFESQTSSSSTPLPTESKSEEKSSTPILPGFTDISDISEAEMKDENVAVRSTSSGKIKSAEEVGVQFSDSLHNALKINAINADVKNKCFKTDKYFNTNQQSLPQQSYPQSATHIVETLKTNAKSQSEPVHFPTNVMVDQNQIDRTIGDRLSVSENVPPSHKGIELLSGMLQKFETEPSKNSTDIREDLKNKDQNENQNSHPSCGISNSAHSLYTTPSSSDHRPINQTFQIIGHESSQNLVKSSLDSGVNSSLTSMTDSGRVTATPSVHFHEVPPSPCSTLERLLTESRVMVEKLEMTSAGSLSAGSLTESSET